MKPSGSSHDTWKCEIRTSDDSAFAECQSTDGFEHSISKYEGDPIFHDLVMTRFKFEGSTNRSRKAEENTLQHCKQTNGMLQS